MIVLDCSALVDIMLGTPDGTALRQLMLDNEQVIAPELLCAELASVIRKLVRERQMDSHNARMYLTDALSLIDEFVPLQPLGIEALNESVRLDHTTYDLFYFVLARRCGATLFTTDRKLAALCKENGVDVVEETVL